MDQPSAFEADESIENAPEADLPVRGLISYLRHAISQTSSDDLVLIPSDISQAISMFPVTIGPSDIQELISLIEEMDTSTRLKLHDSSLCCVARLLLNAMPSLAQERGLFLLLGMIERLTDAARGESRGTFRSIARKRKSLIGQRMLTPLLECFVQKIETNRSRRWAAQLLLELLCESSDNRELLGLGLESLRRSIGSILCHEPDLTLRFLAGGIIREMRAAEYDRELFWTTEDVDQLTLFFEHSESLDLDWIEAFYSFVDEIDRFTTPHLIESIAIGKETIRGNGIYLVTGTDSLTFIIASTQSTWQRPRFVDIPTRFIVPQTACFSNDSTGKGGSFFSIELGSAGYCIVDGQERYPNPSLIYVLYNSESEVISKSIENMVHKALSRTTERCLETESCLSTLGEERPRHVSRAFVPLGGEENVDHGSRFMSGLSETTTQRNSQSLHVRKSSSVVVTLDTGEEVTRKSDTHQRSRTDAEDNTRRRNNVSEEKRGVVTAKPESQEPVSSVIEEILTGDNDGAPPDASCPAKQDELRTVESVENNSNALFEKNVQQKALPEKYLGQDSEDNSEQELCRGDNESPCDFASSSLGSLHFEQQAPHPQTPAIILPEPFPIQPLSQDEATSARTIPNFQCETSQEPMRIDQMTPRAPASENISLNGINHIPIQNTRKSLPSGRMKRPIADGGTREFVDWDEDLRVTDSELELVSNKKAKRASHQLPSVRATKKKETGSSGRKKPQQKAVLPTPKTGIASAKKTGGGTKVKARNTLASSRPRRIAADEAKAKISSITDRSEKRPEDDPIQESTPIGNNSASVFGVCAYNKGLEPQVTFNSGPRQPEISVPQPISSATTKAVAEDVGIPTIDLTILSDSNNESDEQPGYDSHMDIFPNAWTASERDVTDSDNNLSEVNNNNISAGHTYAHSYAEEAIKGRGRLIGSKLAAALSGHGILPSSPADKGTSQVRETKRSICDPPEVRQNLSAVDKTERLSRISKQISQFMSRPSTDAKLDNVHKADVTSEPLDATLKRKETHPIHEKSLINKAVTIGSPEPAQPADGDNMKLVTIRSPEEVSAEKSAEASQPNKHVAPERAKAEGHPYAALIDEHLHRKTQIVSFAVDGPQNQGDLRRSSVPKSITKPQQSSDSKSRDLLKRKGPIDTRENDFTILNGGNRTQSGKRLRFDVDSSTDADRSIQSSPSSNLGKTEILSLHRPPQMFRSQGSMVDENGSPRPLSRIARENRMTGSNIISSEDVGRAHVMSLEREDLSANDKILDSESIRVDYADNDSEADYEEASDDELIDESYIISRFHIPKAYSKQNGGFRSADLVSPKKPSALLASTRHVDEGISEANRPLSFIQRLKGDKKKRKERASSPVKAICEKELRLPTFWESIASRDKEEAKADPTDEQHSGSEYGRRNRGLTVESSPVARSSDSSGSITLVEPNGFEADWERSLRATQRTTLDMLIDASKRLMRHLLDEEDAIGDVVATYDNGCRRLIDQLAEAHRENIENYRRQIMPVRTEYMEACQKAIDRLRASDNVIKELPSIEKLTSAVRKRERLITRLHDLSTTYDSKLNAEEPNELPD